MKATKYTLKVEIEGLSKAIFRQMLQEVMDGLDREIYDGGYIFDDGDSVFWDTLKEEVTF